MLGLSLGRAAIYSVLQLAERLTLAPLAEQSATVQSSRSRAEFFDFSYQVLDSVFALVPVVLVFYLFFLHGVNPFRRFGFDLRAPGRDVMFGGGLFVLIGLGTLVIYGAGRAAGITAELIPADVGDQWWTVPVLVLTALRHSLLEEVIMVAYLFDRVRRIWPRAGIWMIIGGSALLRGAYHLYQGFGPGIGNLLMGLIFGWIYHRYGRVMPLVIAHLLLDVVAFLAFPLVVQLIPGL
ncbi:CPBP family intramembrane metalloprotease [Nesterenkonia lutea]